ncbi:MAG: serine/threonine protein kinase [Deltaproteobacteria bacterium]|nr:serine/threonine protein kinase [Deltaproteobacteria bacterium]
MPSVAEASFAERVSVEEEAEETSTFPEGVVLDDASPTAGVRLPSRRDSDPTDGLSPISRGEATQPRDRTVATSAARFGPYEVLDERGGGGMAEVRRARLRDDPNAPFVALKRLRRHLVASEEHRRMLKEEMRIALMFDHENIVRALDAGEVDGIPYIAFELVEGLSARNLIARSKSLGLPLPACMDLGAQLAAALAYAHQLKGPAKKPLDLVHRDVSPDNVLINQQGVVKLTDFGIVRHRNREFDTQTNVIKGKVQYMSPEAMGEKAVSAAADVFSFGLVLGELLTSTPLVPPSPLGVLAIDDWNRWVERSVPGRRRDVPESIVRLLRGTLERDPRRRPRASSIRDTLEREVGPARPLHAFLLRASIVSPPEPSTDVEQGFDEEPTMG